MHTVIDDTRGPAATAGNFKALPFEYNEAGRVVNDPLAANYDLVANASNIDAIKFIVDGEIVTIQAIDKGTGTTFDVVRYDATRNKELNLSATGQHRWAMVPILALRMQDNAAGDKERALTISSYEVVQGQETTLAKLQSNEPHLWQNFRTRGYNLTSNWQQSLILQGNAAAIRTLAQRAPLNYGLGLGAVSYTHLTLPTNREV